jgi:hypothetical protein
MLAFGAGIINKGYRTSHLASRDQSKRVKVSPAIQMLSAAMSASPRMNTGEPFRGCTGRPSSSCPHQGEIQLNEDDHASRGLTYQTPQDLA